MAYIPSECSLEEYEEVIYSGDAKNRLYVKHGDTIIGTNGDNNASPFASKLTVKRRILKNGSKTITLNNFISQEIDLVLHDYKIEDLSEEIEIKIGTFIDSVNDYVYVPLGKFLIQDNPTTDKDKTTYKLRDFSVKFDFYYNGKPLIDANGGSATKMQILQDICKQAGVVCKINSFTGYNEKIGIYDNSVTARTYIAYLAEQAGKMASINRYGELVFVDITSDDKTATGEKSIIINDALEKRINSFIVEGKSEQETILPSEYTQVDYLQSNGNQYIDIGIKPSATISTKAIFSVTDVNAERNYVYGTYSGTGINRYQISYTSSFIFIGYGSLNERNRTTTVDNNKHYLEEKNGQLTIDNVNVSSLSSTFDDEALNIYLFACNSNGTVSNYSNGVKIYLFEVYNSDTLIRKLVPCYRNSDNVAGMYDVVNNVFYTNNGTGAFTYGSVVTLPNPDYPSEIETVKGIENLFDLEEYPFVDKVAYDASGNKVDWTGYCGINKYFPVEENTTYTFSSSMNKSLYYGLVFYDANKNILSNITVATRTFTTPANCNYIRFAVQNNSLPTWVQIEKGDIVHPSVPYGRYLYNKITGKNICPTDISMWESGHYATDGKKTTHSARIRTINLLPVLPTTYFARAYGYTVIVRTYDKYQNFVRNLSGVSTFTINENEKYIGVSLGESTGKVTFETYQNDFANGTVQPFICLSSEEDKTFEPYKENIITYDLKDNELVSIGDTKDELDEVSGVLTKRIGKIVLNGSEDWKLSGTESMPYIYFSDALTPTSNNVIPNMLCTHYKVMKRNGLTNGYTTLSSTKNLIFYDEVNASNLDTWKTYLSNNPVTVYYILAEEETIQLEPTEISTFEGTNNITLIDNIDTNINVNYEGQKHIHDISPDIVESFTAGDKYKVSKVLFEAGANKFEDGTDDDDILYLNSDNPYINKQTQINNIFPHVKGFEINSFKTGKILGNPAVDPADLIKVEYNGIIYKTLAQYTLNFGGTMTSNYETTVEHEAKQSNVANKGFATKKFVKAELDNIDAKFSVEVGEINDGLSDLETNVTNTANRVSDTESKLNDTNSNLENLIGRTTKLEQDNQSWTFEFNNIYEDLTALNNKTNETDKTTKEIKDYIKFVDGNIILEGTDSKCSVVISKEKISFYTDGNESAFISNNELYITDNTVLNKQTIGKWEIKPDSEGNLNTRWIG